MFAPLKDLERFKAFRLDPELETIVWENGADLAPEFLHARLLVAAEEQLPDSNGKSLSNHLTTGTRPVGIGPVNARCCVQ